MLTNHVETLVTIPPRLVNRRTKDKTYVAGTLRTNSYQQQIIAELLRCFSDPSASACVSRAAVDHALDYFVRHSNFLAVRQLLAILQDNSEYTLTTTNFDIFLAAAAANEDVHNFRLWLRNMLREELKPSPRTWASLHRLVCRRYPGTEMPGRVLSAMRAKGVLTDPETVREWLRDNVERRLTAYLASKTKSEDVDLDAFMSMYDKRYRLPLNQHQLSDARHSSAEQYRPWLTTVTTNIMAKVLLAHGRTQDALAVVRMYEDSGGPLRADTINTFLNAAERARDTGFAVSVLKYFAASAARSSRPAGKGIRLDAISYSTLFNVAWTRKNYNMLRVIWRYACCAGEVRWMVHQMVRTSLLKYVPATTSRRQLEREQGEVRLAEAVESVLKGSKAKKHTSENKEVNVRSRRGEVWSGWVGNFVVGLTDGIEDNRKDTGARAATSSAKSASENDASLHNLAQLTPYAAEMLALATQPRRKPLVISPTEQDPFDTPKTVSLPAHYARRTRLQALIDEDLAQTLHLTPTIPLPELLERAWEMDMQWNEQRLGAPTEAMTWAFYDREATEEQKAGVFVGMFEEMLVKGIEVPVKRVRRQGERGREQKEKEGGRRML
ncbi:hypothetical protein B0A55_10700 [Friedmanniomyces simplex]|uniref:Pentatricopeptide repeat domain-containing protein n=1 Tax=Friedmanniomyces simplex TaxID=329884 RepID=A0A4U0WM21_9PEZI|nr:hypothetical protein B0A55_10700 [Friedmanniomyces simplex]